MALESTLKPFRFLQLEEGGASFFLIIFLLRLITYHLGMRKNESEYGLNTEKWVH